MSRFGIISLSCFLLAAGITTYSLISGCTKENPLSAEAKIPEAISSVASASTIVPDIVPEESSPILEVALPQQSPEKQSTVTIGNGDTMLSVLSSIGMNNEKAHLAIAALRKVYNPKALKIGQELHFVYKKEVESAGASLVSVNFKTSAGSNVSLIYKDGEFAAEKFEVELIKVKKKVKGRSVPVFTQRLCEKVCRHRL